MSRPTKHPDLQSKFEQLLLKALSMGPLSGPEIKRTAESEASLFKINNKELTDLKKNFANYINRARSSGIIRSSGPWSGYELTEDVIKETAKSQTEHREPKEAAAHFVATCALSIQFGAFVKSLPATVDGVQWGNPDMLMLRENTTRSLTRGKINSEILKYVDASPDCILTSIELKYDLDSSRKTWFQAVSEAAANSRWANEALLVHVTSKTDSPSVDNEVLSLARSSEIGILEVSLAESETRIALNTKTIVPPPQRPLLRISEMAGNRDGLLGEAERVLAKWDEKKFTFLDEEGDEDKLASLIRLATQNLKLQNTFKNAPIDEALSRLKSTTVSMSRLFIAAINTATAFTYTAPIHNTISDIQAALRGILTADECDDFSAVITWLSADDSRRH